jgi:uncharacterized membrane protein
MFENDASGLWTDDGDYTTGTETKPDVDEFNRRYETSPTKVQEEPAAKWALRDRLRSKVLWVSVISEIAQIVEIIIQWVKYGITPSSVEVFLLAALGIFTAFGILNDPTNREGF